MAKFYTPIWKAVEGIQFEVGKLSGHDLVISCDGTRDRHRVLHEIQSDRIDPGVAVYFTVGSQRRVLPCDRWNRICDNLQAIHLSLSALRGLDRWGTKQIVDAAFEGFKALPAPTPAEPELPWWEVLGVAESADPVVVEAAYRALAKRQHPDGGGTNDQFTKLNRAYEAGRMRRIQ